MDYNDCCEALLLLSRAYDLSDFVTRLIESYENESEHSLSKLEVIASMLGCSLEEALDEESDKRNYVFAKYENYFLLNRKWKFAMDMAKPGHIHNAISELFNPSMIVPQEALDRVLEERCCHELERIRDVYPDVFPKGTYISDLQVKTDYLVRFPFIEQLTQEREAILNRYFDLFKKAVRTGLSEDEIREFNVFSTHFLAVDAVYPSNFIQYYYVRQIKDVVIKEMDDEGIRNFSDFIKVSQDFTPWKANSFYENPEFARSYILNHPKEKGLIRSFCSLLKNYLCTYTLTDIVDDYEYPAKDILIKKAEDEIDFDPSLLAEVSRMLKSSAVGGIRVEANAQNRLIWTKQRLHERIETGALHEE